MPAADLRRMHETVSGQFLPFDRRMAGPHVTY
jgi:hypothetical protein